MFRFLTKNRQGFTIVELTIVLVLLSFGVLALANMFKVTYRAFNKAEERSIKQEAVKTVAETLRNGQTNVASALSADVYNAYEIIPPTEPELTYSYLFFEPHAECKECGSDWDFDNKRCTKVTVSETVKNQDGSTTTNNKYCNGGRKAVDGYFLKCMNKGMTKSQAFLLSDVPIYVSFAPIRDYPPSVSESEKPDESKKVNQAGVLITLSALEDDFQYENVDEEGNILVDSKATPQLNTPKKPDDVYYSLDVAYHFPNMVLAEKGAALNFVKKGERSTAPLYNADGTKTMITKTVTDPADPTKTVTVQEPKSATSVDAGGMVLRVYSDSIISADSSNTNLSTPSLCFIATASYGRDSGEVGLLCKFRDECLLTNPLGTAFVKAYYKLSPPIADFIADSEPLKAAVRVALKPLVAVATNALDSEAASENAPWFIMFMLCGAGSTAMLIKLSKQRKKAKKAEN